MDVHISPYPLSPPAIINFSGGRSSAYMLYHILDAYGGQLPPDTFVVFTNTGKEREETLLFVQAVSDRWGVPVTWLERDGTKPSHERYRQVDLESASRNGEPFEELITEKQYLPNPVTRFCTVELKIRTMRDWAWGLGWKEWTNVIGFRADEAHRFDRAMRTSGFAEGKQMSLLAPRVPKHLREYTKKPHDAWNHPTAPMIRANVARQDVMDFWAAQPFDLQLKPHEGNCDLCFLKGAGVSSAIIRERPQLAKWWIAQEERILSRVSGHGGQFRYDRPVYRRLLEGVENQAPLDFGPFDDMMSCGLNGCTD